MRVDVAGFAAFMPSIAPILLAILFIHFPQLRSNCARCVYPTRVSWVRLHGMGHMKSWGWLSRQLTA